MTGNEFYAFYGNGRTRQQFDADCAAFFGGLAVAKQDVDSNKSVQIHLLKTRAMGRADSARRGARQTSGR